MPTLPRTTAKMTALVTAAPECGSVDYVLSCSGEYAWPLSQISAYGYAKATGTLFFQRLAREQSAMTVLVVSPGYTAAGETGSKSTSID